MRRMTFDEAVAYYMEMDGLSPKEAVAYVRRLEDASDESPWIWPTCNYLDPFAEPDEDDTSWFPYE